MQTTIDTKIQEGQVWRNKEKGYTIEGAKTYIKEAKKKPMNSFEIIEKLNEIKSRLLKIKKEL